MSRARVNQRRAFLIKGKQRGPIKGSARVGVGLSVRTAEFGCKSDPPQLPSTRLISSGAFSGAPSPLFPAFILSSLEGLMRESRKTQSFN